jgi:hypothetical protein
LGFNIGDEVITNLEYEKIITLSEPILCYIIQDPIDSPDIPKTTYACYFPHAMAWWYMAEAFLDSTGKTIPINLIQLVLDV